MSTRQTPEEHQARHVELHRALDELMADFMRHTSRLASQTTVMDLLEWAHEQTVNPTEVES